MHVMQPHDGSLCTHFICVYNTMHTCMYVYNTNDDNKHTCAALSKNPKMVRRKGEKRTKRRDRQREKNMRSFLMSYGLCTFYQRNENFNIC